MKSGVDGSLLTLSKKLLGINSSSTLLLSKGVPKRWEKYYKDYDVK